MPDVQEVFRMATQKVRPEPGFVDRQQEKQRRRSRRRKGGALALAAAIAVVALVLIVGTWGGQDRTTPADQPTVNPTRTTAEDVAMDFLDAWASFNTQQAVSYLADDADITGFGVQGVREFRLLIAFREATGFEVIPTSCEEAESFSPPTHVYCAFDFHAIRSEEIGRGPYAGSIDITVKDGQVVRASPYLELAKFSPQMWEPFSEWISTNYPKDVAAMYVGNFSDYRLTRESIHLWEQHSRDFVEAVKQGTA